MWPSTLEMMNTIQNFSQFFAIPCDTIHADKVLSLMQGYWTRKRKMLNIRSLSRLLFLLYGFKGISHTDSHSNLMSCAQLLNKISSIQKYKWAREGQQLESRQ
jgi:hypothetical protein